MCVCGLLNLFCPPSLSLSVSHGSIKIIYNQYKQWQEEKNKQIRASDKQCVHSSNASSHPSTHSVNETMQHGGWLVQRWCDMFCQETTYLLFTMHKI